MRTNKAMLAVLTCLIVTAGHVPAQDITDAESLQKAINAAVPYSEIVISERIEVRTPITLRGTKGLRLRCTGAGVLVSRFQKPAAVNWTVVDATGANGLTFDGFRITVPRHMVYPACGLLLARDTDGGSSAGHLLRSCHIGGYFHAAALYNIGSELLRVVDSSLNSKGPGACYMTSSWNLKKVQPPHGAIGGSTRIGGSSKMSNVVQWFERVHFGRSGERPAPCVVLYPESGMVNINNCSFSAKGTALRVPGVPGLVTLGPTCSIYIGYDYGWGPSLYPMYAGTMTGNYAEYEENWAAIDIVIAVPMGLPGGHDMSVFKDPGGQRGRLSPEGYPDLMKLNPGFRRGVRFVDRSVKGFPHP